MLGSMLTTMMAMAAPGASPAPVLASAPYFRALGVAEGLPSSTVWKLAQDRDGYIWIGTADGLARYDGVGFRIYRHSATRARWRAMTSPRGSAIAATGSGAVARTAA